MSLAFITVSSSVYLNYVLIVEAMTEAGNLSVEVPIVIGTRPFQGE